VAVFETPLNWSISRRTYEKRWTTGSIVGQRINYAPVKFYPIGDFDPDAALLVKIAAQDADLGELDFDAAILIGITAPDAGLGEMDFEEAILVPVATPDSGLGEFDFDSAILAI
jgi:hypothetical protein